MAANVAASYVVTLVTLVTYMYLVTYFLGTSVVTQFSHR